MDQPIITTDESFVSGESDLESLLGRTVKMPNGALIFCTHGEARVRINMREYHITVNTGVILLDNDAVSLLSRSDDFRVHFFAFSREMFRVASFRLSSSFFYFLKMNPCYTHQNPKATEAVNGLTKATTEAYRDRENRFRGAIAQNLLQIFFLDAYDKTQRYAKAEINKFDNNKDQIFSNFIDLVHQHCSEHRDVTFYANQLCITARHLGTICNERGFNSPKKIIDDILMVEIKVALTSTNLSIKQIADKFSFPDQSLFGRYFKAHTGTSPAKFRGQE